MAKMQEIDFVVDENSDSALQNSNVPTYQYDAQLEGELSSPNRETKFNTLDEPVKETIKRDVKAVGLKFFHVLYPKQKKALLQDWDLWGPLILCVFLALMLHGSSVDKSSENDGGLQFAEVFSVVWLGAVIVTLNSKLLGGALSFFQSVCVLGYCLLAPSISLIACRILNAILPATTAIFIIKFCITMLGLGWAVFASVAFLGDSQPPRRKALAVYPIFLFYFAISWLIILHSI